MKMKLDAQKYRRKQKDGRKMKSIEKPDPVLLVEPWGSVLNQDSYLPGQSIVRQCGDAVAGFWVTNCIRDCPQVLQMNFISRHHTLIVQPQAVSGVMKGGKW